MRAKGNPPRLSADVLGENVRAALGDMGRNISLGLIQSCAHLAEGETRRVLFVVPWRGLCSDCRRDFLRRQHARNPWARGRCDECGDAPPEGTVALHFEQRPYVLHVDLCRPCARETGLWPANGGHTP